MSMSGNTIGGRAFGDGVGFENDPYSILDDLLHDDSEEKVISTRNKYFAQAAKIFLEEMNFKFVESPVTEPRLVVSLNNNSFKFVSHMEDHVTIDLPYDWDIMENEIRDHVKSNPVVQTEVKAEADEWNNDPMRDEEKREILFYVKSIQSRLNVSPSDAIKLAEEYMKKMYSKKIGDSVYSSSTNPELKIKSGVYDNVQRLLIENNLMDEFNKTHKEGIIRYLNENQKVPNLELNLILSMGFDHIKDNITVDESPYITNRIVNVKFEGQDNFKMPTFTEDDFKNDNNQPSNQ